jgi:hypothetical protein
MKHKKRKKVICNAEIYLKLKKNWEKSRKSRLELHFFFLAENLLNKCIRKALLARHGQLNCKKNTTHALHGFHVATANERGRMEAEKNSSSS